MRDVVSEYRLVVAACPGSFWISAPGARPASGAPVDHLLLGRLFKLACARRVRRLATSLDAMRLG